MAYLSLALILIIIILVTSIVKIPFLPVVQSIAVTIAMIVFFIIMRAKLKPSLIFFHKILKDVIKNDLTLDDDDILNINTFSNFTLLNPKMLIKYTNLILRNQNTILETARSDRDFIN